MEIDARHLALLALVVEHGGISGGAAAAGKSQPSVSRTLAFLEARIGQPLFVPGRRPAQPTPLGRELAQKGSVILRAAVDARDLVRNYRDGRLGSVRVGGTPFFMDGVVSGFIAEFQLNNGDVQIEQSYGYTADLLSKLADGQIDLVICPLGFHHVSPKIDFIKLLPGRNVIACSKDHPLVSRPRLTAEDVVAYPWITPPPDSPLYADLKHHLAELNASTVKISFSSGSLASTLTVLTGSDALTILPYSVVVAASVRNNIAMLPLRVEHPDRTLGIVTQHNRPMSPAMVKAHGFLRQRFVALREEMARLDGSSGFY